MAEFRGFDHLQRQLEEASKAFQSLDGEVARVAFDPNDQASVHAAIQYVEAVIDQKLAPYRGNVMVESVGGQLKEKYHDAILQRAADARNNPEAS